VTARFPGSGETHSREPAHGGVLGAGGKGKIDGVAKVTGAARYTGDLVLPRMVHCKVVRSLHAHGRILSIDTSEARAMPGVLAVLTGEDLPIRYGALPVAQDETALAIGKVRYVGEPVACVCATSEELAWEACRAVRVMIEPLEPVLGIDAALDAASPVIHDEARKPSNILRSVSQSWGDVDAGLAEADLVRTYDYVYPGSTHVPLESHAALADWDGKRLTVWSSTQNPHYLHRTIARVLDVDASDIRLIKPEVGAGYGGKCDAFVTDLCVAYLARKLGRPVRFVLEREEVFYAHRGRHETRMRLTMGMKRDGTITAVDLEAWADGGAYASYGVVTAYYLGVFGTLPYRLDNYRFQATRLYTNKPPCGPKRGHGAVQPRFAFEVHLDRMCAELGLDSLEVRRAICVEPASTTANGLRVTSVGLLDCLEQVTEASAYRDRKGRLGRGRGLGLAASAYMCGALHAVYQNDLPHSGVQLKIDRSGRVTVFAGTADVGQGSSTMLAVLVAERLGLSVADVTVVEGDTDLTPVDLGSYSSRVTFMAGNAAIAAADRVRAQIAGVLAAAWECAPEDIVPSGGVWRAGAKDISWVKAVELAEARLGTLGAVGSYKPPTIGSRFQRTSVGPSPAYSFTAQVAEVEVDEETGIVRVERIWCAHDLGRTIHPQVAEGQVEGCVYMGVGEALLEEQRYHEDGLMTGPSILEYRIPTVTDTPDIVALLVESHDPEGPYGAKEVGEGPQLGTVPAIANAIHDAVGVWLTDPPFTPEKVLAALRERDR
jgi:4-hydroxybenzoyl-CoA reductase alpha subunit